MRPPTHDDPDAIPRNGTDVPWPEVPDLTDGAPGPREPGRASESPPDRQRSPGTAARRGT